MIAVVTKQDALHQWVIQRIDGIREQAPHTADGKQLLHNQGTTDTGADAHAYHGDKGLGNVLQKI